MMKNILQSALAIIVALLSSLIIIMVIQTVSHGMFPPPEGLNMQDADAMAAHVTTLPLMAFIMVLLSYGVAVLDGVLISTWLAPKAPRAHSGFVFALLSAGAIANVTMIPHPMWFLAACFAVYIAAAFVGDLVGHRLRRQHGKV